MAGQQAARGKGSAAAKASGQDDDLGKPGPPMSNRSPFVIGFFGGLGALVAFFLYGLFLMVGSVLILIVVAFFLAVGLDPATEFFMRRGLKRHWAVVVVITFVVIAFALFMVAIVPVVSDQVSSLVEERAGLARPAPEQQDDRAARREVRRDLEAEGVRHQRRARPAGRRWRAGCRA